MKKSNIKQTSLYIEEFLLQELKIVAAKKNKKVNDLIIRSIRNYLKKIK